MTRQIPRLLARAPIPLYRAGLGFLLGRRLTMLEHRGRTSGLPRYVVLEVLARDAQGLVIVSGYGGRAQWYRNVLAHSGVRVWTGRRRGMPAQATKIPAADVPRRLEDYRRSHRRAAAALGRTLDIPELGSADPLPVDVASRLPLVRIEFERS
jgi:deazaflavin-dependent oxidoreductase (nitroreductase family)